MCNRKKQMLTKTEHDILNNGFNELKDNAFIQFAKGKAEHGGSLEGKPCYYFKKPELIDLLVYELFDNEQRKKVIAICNEAIEDTDINGLAQDKFKEIKNILETGNKEGKTYNE